MNSSRTRSLLRLLLVLAAAVLPWVFLILWVPWAEQDFPLIDDWAFARGAYSFYRGEGIDYQRWASMPLLGQWLWAAPFLMLFGESHRVLRMATLVLSCLGLLAFHDLMRRRAEVSPPVAAFATACLAWSPFFFLLSGTFMTDVPALSFSLIALALYARAMDGNGFLPLAGAAVVALVAAATRQNTIAAPLTAGVLLFRSPYRARPLWIAAVAVPVSAAFALHFWLNTRSDVVPLHAQPPTLERIVWLGFTSAHYLGLMVAPVLLLIPSRDWGKVFWTALALMTVGAVVLAFSGRSLQPEGLFPYLEDIVTARGTYVTLEGNRRPALFSLEAHLLPTALGCWFAAALVARMAAQGRTLLDRPLVLFSLLQLGALVISPKLYDRYLLSLVPGALCIAALGQQPPRWKRGITALVLLGGLSLCLAHDWFSWNAARWVLGRRAVAHGIKGEAIQGGMEWNHWHPRVGPSHYRMSLTEHRHAVTIDSQPFTLWLPPRKGAVYLLSFPLNR
jgi:hypothetical protein